MTALGINATDRDTPATWGAGNVSGHLKPAKVQLAYDHKIACWAKYIEATDHDNITSEYLQALKHVATQADQTYRMWYLTWQASMGECECRPGRPNEDDHTCASCVARMMLDDGEDMPF